MLRSSLFALLATTVLAVPLLLSGCPPDESEAAVEKQETRTYVRTASAERRDLIKTLELTGIVEAARSANLVTDIPGKIKRLPVKVGDKVRKGALLAQLDTDMASLQADQAAAMVALAEVGLETARREFDRAKSLHDQGGLSSQMYEQAHSGVQMAEQQLAQARAAQGLAGKQVSGGRLLAPFSGVITYVAQEEGEYFNPMTISPLAGPGGLVGIVDPSKIHIDLQVADSDVVRFAAGMETRIFVDALSERLPADGVPGVVESVGVAADTASRTFPVRVVADNADGAILAGTHARVRLVLDRVTDALVVPEDAVIRADGGYRVLVVQGERVRYATVEIGIEGDDGIHVLAGLNGDELLVAEGNLGLADNSLIEVLK
jgi:RND family efflux transporter MFP subunit